MEGNPNTNEKSYEELKDRVPEGTQFYVLGLLASIKNGLSLKEAGENALAEIKASEGYDRASATSMKLTEKAIRFLEDEGVE